MTKDELKALGLTDEQAEAIVNDLGKNFVAKSQFNAKLEELKAAKAEKETMGGELDKLRKENKVNEGLTAQLDAIKKAAKERERRYGRGRRKGEKSKGCACAVGWDKVEAQ